MVARSALIGREAALDAVSALVGTRALVTLIGPGGVGKTRLALEVVERLDRDRFPDEATVIELAPLDEATDVASAAAAQLGLDDLGELATALDGRRSLLVLDNCEHVLDGVADLIMRLQERNPEISFLATSREPLDLDGEHLVPVDPLAVPLTDESADPAASPAVSLFLERARSAGATLDDDDVTLATVGVLCRRLDGMPLAIELAAARTRSIPPEALLDLIEERLDVLSRRRGERRHRSLTAAIDASYRLLDDGERLFFNRLGVFRGRFDVALAHAVAGPAGSGETATVELLSGLVDRSLVVVEPAGGPFRYRVLETLRTYAADRLGDDLPVVVDRFVEVMTARANDIVEQSLGVWSGELLGQLMAVYRSIISAIEHCIDGDATGDRAFALYQPLWGLAHDSRSAEIEAVGRRSLERWPSGTEPLRATTGAVWATALLLVGRVREANRVANGVVDADERMARFMGNRVLAFAAIHAGNWDEAVGALERSLEAAKLLGAPSYENLIRISLVSARMSARPDRAVLDDVGAIVADAAEQGDTLNLILAVEMAARAELILGHPDRARQQLDVVRDLLARVDYPSGAAALTRLEVWLAVHQRGWDGALSTVLAAIEEHARLGDLRQESHVHLLRLLAWLALRHGDETMARQLVRLAPVVQGFVFEPGIVDPALDELVGPASIAGPSGSWVGRLEAARRALVAEVGPDVGDEAKHDGRPVAAAGVADGRWHRVAAGWEVGLGSGEPLVLPAMKGLADLAILIGRSGVEVHALELMGGVDTGDAGPMIDERATREYQARIRDLQTDIDEAGAANDPERAARAELELDALVDQLAAGLGLGRRARSVGSAAERARSAVTWRLRAAIKRVGEYDEDLGRHLAHSVRTGTWCVYDPEHPVAWSVRTEASP